ncbi:uncharacterized protein LOC141629872 [Silene latifolia]|uniref:uncharacterized protein LOC141629872 n=1 Tax=Silene latifolia TaxID=37657 RepID=UPI003D788A0B
MPETPANNRINIDDPHYVHNTDIPGIKLVNTPFGGTGFGNWRREIAVSVLYCNTAQEAWEELEARFGQSNGAQLYGVHKKLNDFSHGNDNIVTSFTKIKSIWDEVYGMGMNPKCSCPCACGAKAKQLKFQEDQKVIQFLMSLNESYSVIRGTILMQNPLPKLALVYNNLLQKERQREIHSSTQVQVESAVLYARNNFQNRNNNSWNNSGSGYRYQGTFGFNNSGYASTSATNGVSNPQTSTSHGAQGNTSDDSTSSANFAGTSSSTSLDFHADAHSIVKIDTVGSIPLNNHITLQNDSSTKHLILGNNQNDLYLLHAENNKTATANIANIQDATVNSVVSTVSCYIWHNRIGHLPLYMLKHLRFDVSSVLEHKLRSCSICAKARQHRLSFNVSNTISFSSFEMIHIDLWGPYHTPTCNGYKYFLTIVDDFSRCTWTHLLSSKNNALPMIKNFLNMVETQFNKKVKIIRYMIILLNLDLNLQLMSPFQLLFGKVPDLTHMGSFGCLVYASTPMPGRDKFSPRAFKCVFLGYPFGKKAYILLNLDTHAILTSRDVVFHETIFLYVTESSNSFIPLPVDDTFEITLPSTDSDISIVPPNTTNFNSTSSNTENNANTSTDIQSTTVSRQSTRVSKTSSYLQHYVCNLPKTSCNVVSHSDYCCHTLTSLCENQSVPVYACKSSASITDTGSGNSLPVQEPKTFAEASTFPEWQEAIAAEFQALANNNTWSIVPLPAGKNVIASK